MCETQLCATVHDILADKDQTVHVDFTKAFDRAPHALLTEKFSKIETIDEYLLCWTHNVGCNLGNMLVPVSFLVFINDLPKEVD